MSQTMGKIIKIATCAAEDPEKGKELECAAKALNNLLNSDGNCFVAYGWLDAEEPEDGQNWIAIPNLQNGSTGKNVKALQILLIGNNCSCGKYGADGKFGTATQNAVMMFQDKTGLPVSGICDAYTWTKLLGL